MALHYTRVSITLPERLLEDLDRFCRERGLSRSAFISQVLTHYLWEITKEALDEYLRLVIEIYDQREQRGLDEKG